MSVESGVYYDFICDECGEEQSQEIIFFCGYLMYVTCWSCKNEIWLLNTPKKDWDKI